MSVINIMFEGWSISNRAKASTALQLTPTAAGNYNPVQEEVLKCDFILVL